MKMTRKVRLADASEIADIYNVYVEETTVSFETDPVDVEQMRQRVIDVSSEFPYLVYEIDGKIVGYAYAHRWKERAAYSNTLETTIYVDRKMKHCGIGTELMHELVEECRRRNFHVLIACITGENLASMAFHKRLGFKEVSHFHDVGKKFGRWLDVIDMELQL